MCVRSVIVSLSVAVLICTQARAGIRPLDEKTLKAAWGGVTYPCCDDVGTCTYNRSPLVIFNGPQMYSSPKPPNSVCGYML